MTREVEVLKKLKAGLPLTEADKDAIYEAIEFIKGSYTTTLMHEIILLDDGVKILQSLDPSKFIGALNKSIKTCADSTTTYSPLEWLVHQILYNDPLNCYAYSEIIHDIITKYGATVEEHLLYVLEHDYCSDAFLTMVQDALDSMEAHPAQVNRTVADFALQEPPLTGDMPGSSAAILGFMQ